MRTMPLIAVAFGLTGCAFEVDPNVFSTDGPSARPPARHAAAPRDATVAPPPKDETPAWDASRTFRGITDGHIGGSVGPTDVDAPADLAYVYDDGYYAQLEVYALRTDGVRVMLSLQ